jgi:hypothetical protein
MQQNKAAKQDARAVEERLCHQTNASVSNTGEVHSRKLALILRLVI